MQNNPLSTSEDRFAKDIKETAHTVKENVTNAKNTLSNSVYEIAEDARLSVVKAIHSAAKTLQDLKENGAHKADGAGHYVTTLASRLDHLSKRLGDKDAVEIGEDAKELAKRYQTPLILGGLALAYWMLKPNWSNRD